MDWFWVSFNSSLVHVGRGDGNDEDAATANSLFRHNFSLSEDEEEANAEEEEEECEELDLEYFDCEPQRDIVDDNMVGDRAIDEVDEDSGDSDYVGSDGSDDVTEVEDCIDGDRRVESPLRRAELHDELTALEEVAGAIDAIRRRLGGFVAALESEMASPSSWKRLRSKFKRRRKPVSSPPKQRSAKDCLDYYLDKKHHFDRQAQDVVQLNVCSVKYHHGLEAISEEDMDSEDSRDEEEQHRREKASDDSDYDEAGDGAANAGARPRIVSVLDVFNWRGPDGYFFAEPPLFAQELLKLRVVWFVIEFLRFFTFLVFLVVYCFCPFFGTLFLLLSKWLLQATIVVGEASGLACIMYKVSVEHLNIVYFLPEEIRHTYGIYGLCKRIDRFLARIVAVPVSVLTHDYFGLVCRWLRRCLRRLRSWAIEEVPMFWFLDFLFRWFFGYTKAFDDEDDFRRFGPNLVLDGIYDYPFALRYPKRDDDD